MKVGVSVGCLKTCKESITRTAEEAIEKLYNSKYHVAFIIGSDKSKLSSEIDKVYEEIKQRNKQVEDLDNQMLPTLPYFWDDIDGCLAVHCAEIHMNDYEEASKCIALFTGHNYDVLTDPSAVGTPGIKAMASLAMIGSMIC